MAKSSVTSMTVAGVGAVVTGIGRMMHRKRGNLGAMVTGFGLAHVALGLLDMFRPTVRKHS